jgi:hypothetical protein
MKMKDRNISKNIKTGEIIDSPCIQGTEDKRVKVK